jgi:hypothetical protein
VSCGREISQAPRQMFSRMRSIRIHLFTSSSMPPSVGALLQRGLEEVLHATVEDKINCDCASD